jgi:hypothetical protein
LNGAGEKSFFRKLFVLALVIENLPQVLFIYFYIKQPENLHREAGSW